MRTYIKFTIVIFYKSKHTSPILDVDQLAKSWNDVCQGVNLIEAPQLNIMYSDVEGNIGYWVSGKVPIRAKGKGMVPAPGWTGDYEWIGAYYRNQHVHRYNCRI